jgi:hypothetical protein
MIAIALPAVRANPAGFPPGTVRLWVVDPVQQIDRLAGQAVNFANAFSVTTHGGTFEVRSVRESYDVPITAQTADATGRPKSLPSQLVSSLLGFSGAVHLHVTDAHGAVVADYDMNWCPNASGKVRLNSNGPASLIYPDSCAAAGNPFARSEIWGIEQGWAVPLVDGQVQHLTGVADGTYHVSASWTPAMTAAFGFTKGAVSATVIVATTPAARIATAPAPGPAPLPHPIGAPAPVNPQPSISVLSTVPNLVAVPAWGITTRFITGHDYLTFGATIYNDGPQPLIVEGFRRGRLPIMDAYQYLFMDGTQVGRVLVGTMEYDPRPGHKHWHFTDFARYELLDASKANPVVSGKEAFCLANTDAMDMLAPNVEWRTPEDNLGSVCGKPSSTFIRETLSVGYGDTYDQARPGQAFDITSVPNGTYYIRITANPNGHLYETTTRDNVSLRKIVLGGTPTHRTVNVLPVGLITSH